MDDNARRQLAFSIANNRTQNNVAGKASALYDWMTKLGEAGEQALIAANNQVSPQSSLVSMIGTAANNYEFTSGTTIPKAVATAVAKGLADGDPAGAKGAE